LLDLVSVGLLSKVFSAEVVDAVITQCGRTEQRRRSFLACSMVFFAMGVALYCEGSCEDVLVMVFEGLAWVHRDVRSGKLVNREALSHVCDRLGPEPMALLFERAPSLWLPKTSLGAGWRAGDWSPLMGSVWICPTRQLTTPTLAGLGW